MIGVKTGLDISSVNKTKQEFTKLLADMQNQANRNPIKINIQNTTSQINQINQSMNTLGNSSNNTSNSFKNLGSSLGSLTGFYMRWLSVSSLVNLALAETRKAINFAFEQDERVRNVSMISGESRKEVQGYTKDWNALALELKQSTSIVAESNEEWLRSGANLKEVGELSKMTIKTSEIAGSNIKDTTSQAIALKNAYGMTGTELKKVLDGVVKMDNTTATGTDRLLRSLLVTSSSAKQAKIPIDWLVASLTTVQSKSKQTSESIGKNFRNIALNMTKMTSGKDQVGLNKAEDQLNKVNIALRINKDTFRSTDKVLDDLAKKWGTLTEVQQAELGASLAGKENINTFNILMQNQAETLKNLNNIKQAGGSVDKAYEEHLISAKGALGELKATLEHLYTQLINGDVLKKVLNDLTKVVQVVEFLITDGANLGKAWLGLIIVAKNFKLVEVGIMTCVTAFKYLTAFGLESLTLLSFNPIVLSLTALIAVVGAVTYSQYQHSQQVKELKTSYEELTKSMNEMDGSSIKASTDKLKEQQIELDKLGKKASESYDVDMGLGYSTNGDKEALEKFISTLEEAGFHVDETTNKIVELQGAESNIATSDTVKKIQDKTNATIEEATETQGLIGQYLSLSNQENKSADQKKILSNLTTELSGRVKGLTVTTDEHGNAVINNVGYLGNQVTALDLVKQQSVITGNTEIEMAINSSSAIHDGTIQTLDDMKTKILSYQSLNNALSNTSAGKGGFFGTIISANKIGEKGLQDSVDRIESLKSKFNMKAPTLGNAAGGAGYIAPKLDKDTKALKDVSASAKDTTKEMTALEKATKNFETALRNLHLQMKIQDDSLSKLNKSGDEYKKGLIERQKLTQKEIDLTKENIKVNIALSKNPANYTKTTKTTNGGSSTGQAVVAETRKYLGTKYVYGGNDLRNGIDCSGLVQQIYKSVGKELSRTTYTQINEGKSVAKANLQPGDLVFFGTPSNPHHVGIYAGNGNYLHAPKTGDVVKESSLSSRSDYLTGRRIVSGGKTSSSSSSSTTGDLDDVLSKIDAGKTSLIDSGNKLREESYEIFETQIRQYDAKIKEFADRNEIYNNKIEMTDDPTEKLKLNEEITRNLNKQMGYQGFKQTYIEKEIASGKFNNAQQGEQNKLRLDAMKIQSDLTLQVQNQEKSGKEIVKLTLQNIPQLDMLDEKLKKTQTSASNLFDSDSVGKVLNQIGTVGILSTKLDTLTKSYSDLSIEINANGIMTKDEKTLLDGIKVQIQDTTQAVIDSMATLETLGTINMLKPFENILYNLNLDMERYNFLIKASDNASYETQINLSTRALANNESQMSSLIREYQLLSNQALPTTAKGMTDYVANLEGVKAKILSVSQAQAELRKSFQNMQVEQVMEQITIPQAKIQKIVSEIDFQVSMGEENLSNLVGAEFTTTTKSLDETISQSASEANDIATNIDDKLSMLTSLSTEVDTSISSNINNVITAIQSATTDLQTSITNNKGTMSGSASTQSNMNSAGGVWVPEGYSGTTHYPAGYRYQGVAQESDYTINPSTGEKTYPTKAKTLNSNSWKDGLVTKNSVASDLPSVESLNKQAESATTINELLIIKEQLTTRDVLASKANIAYLETQKVDYADNADILKRITSEQETQLSNLQKQEKAIQDIGKQIVDSILISGDKAITELRNEIKMMGAINTPIEFTVNYDNLTSILTNLQSELKTLTDKKALIIPVIGELEKLKTSGTLTDEQKLKLIELRAMVDEIDNKTIDITVEINSNADEVIKIINDKFSNEIGNFTETSTKLKNALTFITNSNSEDYTNIEKIQKSIYDNSKKQYDLSISQSAGMLRLRNSISDVGSDEWNVYDKKLQEINASIEQSILEMQEQQKALLKTSLDSSVSNIEKIVFDGSTQDVEQARIDSQKKYNGTYIEGAEKALVIDKIRLGIQTLIRDTADESAKAVYQSQLNSLDLLEQQGELTRTDLERYQKKLEIAELEQQIVNAQNQKTTKTYTQKADGSWDFAYSADQDKIDSLNEDLKQKQVDLIIWERDTKLTSQQDDLTVKSDYMTQLQAIITKAENGQYTSQAKFQSALDALNAKFGKSGVDLNTNITAITTAYGVFTVNMITLSSALSIAVTNTTKTLADAVALLAESAAKISTGTTSIGKGYEVTRTKTDGTTVTGVMTDSEYQENKQLIEMLEAQGTKFNVKKFASGGETQTTGIHWLDGESSKPERVLSARQTSDFGRLVQELPKTLSSMERLQTPKLYAKDILPHYELPMIYMSKGLVNMSDAMEKLSLNMSNDNPKQGISIASLSITCPSVKDGSSMQEIYDTLYNLPHTTK